jgi:uncharacterized membrane-anchored protein YhcB (DUF1043 family)
MTTTAILIALGGFLVGILAGLILGRYPVRRDRGHNRLADQLRVREEKLQVYERQVAEHFSRTAALADDLGRAWQDLQHHLADGAGQLTSTELARRFSAVGTSRSSAVDTNGIPQPPRDYAPSQDLLRRGPKAVAEQHSGKDPAGTIATRHMANDDDPTLKVG